MTPEEKKAAEDEAAKADADAKAKADADAAAADEAAKKAAGEGGHSKNEIDYKALAEAEKARADAAEALIVKNKNLAKQNKGQEDETPALTEERVAELIAAATKNGEQSEEAKKLEDAQKVVKQLEAKNAEIARALKGKESANKEGASEHRDGLPSEVPKLPENSPLKSYKYMGKGIYSKKLASGKTMFKNVNPAPGEHKTWIE